MKRIIAITISALLLSGCIAMWKNPKGPQRYKSMPTIMPASDR